MKRLNVLMALLMCVAMAFAQNIKRLEQKANNGDTDAQLELAQYYRWKSNIADSREKAAYWYMQAAEQGNAKAQYELGKCYHNGHVVQKDVDKAFYWYNQAATRGYVDAQIFLARSYVEGKEVEKNRELSLYWYGRAAEQDDTDAMLCLARAYEKGVDGIGKNYKLSAYWYDKMSKANPDNLFTRWSAIRMRGLAYYEGSGLEQDYSKAFACFMEAKEECPAELGDCYFYGHGVKADFGEAVFWYNEAVEHSLVGRNKGLHGLARCYYEGKGVKQDFLTAIHLWERLGDAESAYNLGKCYELGTGVARDLSAANNWYFTAAGKGNVRAMYLLGYRHRRGENISKDVKQAVGYYEQLLAVPDSLFSKTDLPLKTFAKLELATIYGYGEGGVRLDVQKASHLLEGLAKDFMFADEVSVLLGDIHYEDGARGTQGSYEKAVSFLEKAKSSDESNVHAAAAFLFAKCYRFGRGVPQDVAKADKLLKEAVSYGWGKFSSVSELVPTFKIEHTWPMPAGF